MIFFIIFTISLLIATIITIKRKKFLYFFFPMILFLPSYYSIDLGTSLPLITATRILYLIFFGYITVTYKKEMKESILSFKPNLPFYFICGYFVLRTISNLYYAPQNLTSVKTILFLLFEELSICCFAYFLALKKQDYLKIVEWIVYGSSIIFIFGIFESFTGFRIFDYLYTAHRYLGNEHYIRLGLMRSTVTSNFACSYGNVCLLMTPLILLMYELKRKRRFLFICVLDIMAVIHSGTRSSMLFILFIYGLSFFIHLKEKTRIILFLKNVSLVGITIMLIITALSVSNSKYSYYYLGTAKSVLNEIGFDFDLNQNAPENVDGYGTNSEGTTSRTLEFTAIIPALKVNPFFGRGSGAFDRGEVRYYRKDGTSYRGIPDVGMVLSLVEEGVVGFTGYILLFLSLSFMLIKKRATASALSRIINSYFSLSLIAFIIGTITTSNQKYYLFTLVFLIISYSIDQEES